MAHYREGREGSKALHREGEGGCQSHIIERGRRKSKLMETRVNIKHFGLLALWGQWLMEPRVYWPHRASNLHDPLALVIDWPFTHLLNSIMLYTFTQVNSNCH